MARIAITNYDWNLHYQADRDYWWSRGRRELVGELLVRFSGSLRGKKILDLGCGSGLLLAELQKKGAGGFGIDKSARAVAACRQQKLKIKRGVANHLPYSDRFFDVVIALDLLEHINSEEKVLDQINRVLKNGGYFLVTVPAFPSLWSSRDKRLGHFRRYRREDLQRPLEDRGFKIKKSSYFISFFFPWWLLRTSLERLAGDKARIKTDLLLVPGVLNSVLLWILRTENELLKYFDLPFGVSLLVLVQKR